jgi:hypothetical protein
LSGKPPEGETGTMELVVTAKDGSGHIAGVKVSLNLRDADSKNAEGTENLAAAVQQEAGDNEENRSADKENGPPALREQISDYGQSGMLKAAQRLLRNL